MIWKRNTLIKSNQAVLGCGDQAKSKPSQDLSFTDSERINPEGALGKSPAPSLEGYAIKN